MTCRTRSTGQRLKQLLGMSMISLIIGCGPATENEVGNQSSNVSTNSEIDDQFDSDTRPTGVIYDFRLDYGARPVAVMGQAVNNDIDRVVVAARGWDRGLWWAYKKSDGRFYKWRRLADNIKDDPIIMSNEDGRLEIFFRGTDDNIYKVYQGNDRRWSGKIPMGFKTRHHFRVFSNKDGRLEAFAIEPNSRKLWHAWQHAPNSNWSYWAEFQSSPQLFTLDITKNTDGRMQIFGVDRNRYLWTTHQHTVNGNWVNWRKFTNDRLAPSYMPAIGREKDSQHWGLITVAFRTSNNRIVIYKQTWKNTDSWTKVADISGCPGCSRQLQFRKWDWTDLHNVLFAVDDNMRLRYTNQYSINGNSWSGWRLLDGVLGKTDFSVETMFIKKAEHDFYPSVMTFAIFGNGNIRAKWQIEPVPTNWGHWTYLSNYENINIVGMTTIMNKKGCISVFGVTNNRYIRFNDQNPTPYCNDPYDWKGWRWLNVR